MEAIAHFIFTFLFWKYVQSQADTSFAMLWTSSYTSGNSAIGVFFGDPESYLPLFELNDLNANYTIQFIEANSTLPKYHSIAVDVLSNQIFISDSSLSRISAASNAINSSTTSILFDPFSLLSFPVSLQVTGLVFDWLSRNLYWSDAGNNHICLVEMTNRAYWRPVINADLTSVQDIAVHPSLGFLFWIDVGSSPRIERSDLLGNNRMVLVDPTKLPMTYPTKLGIDLLYGRLCWLDSQQPMFACTDFQGNVVTQFPNSFFRIFSSFVIYKKYIYFGVDGSPTITVLEMRSTTQLHQVTSLDITSDVGNLTGIIDMAMYSNQSQQPGSSPCMNSNGGCAQICVTMSSTTKVCQCSVGYFLDSDGTSCVTQTLSDDFLLMTDPTQKTIYQVKLTTGEIHTVRHLATSTPTVMDYDPTEQFIYWFDNSLLKRIWKTSLRNGTQTSVYSSSSSITSLAVDVYGRKLYSASPDSGKIQEMSLDGTQNRVILTNAQPTAIVVDGVNRVLYFSECATRTIQTINLDNISLKIVIVSGLSNCVTSMAMNFSAQIMYLGDASGNIQQSDFIGSNRRFLHQTPTSNISGLAIDSNYVYVADQNANYLTKIDRSSKVVTRLTSVAFLKPFSVCIPSLLGPIWSSTVNSAAKTTSLAGVVTTSGKLPSSSGSDDLTTSTPPTTTTYVSSSGGNILATNTSPQKSINSSSTETSMTTLIIIVVVVVGGIIIITATVTVGVVICKKCCNESKPVENRNTSSEPPVIREHTTQVDHTYDRISMFPPTHPPPLYISLYNKSPAPADNVGVFDGISTETIISNNADDGVYLK